MTLTNIFEKPIDRRIEGVIKADDEANLHQEVEEYVLTREVAKRLNNFLSAYNDYQGANGVWISGFFGSGKSHLLKMLSLLFDNRAIDDIPTLDLFRPKLANDTLLRADVEHAVAIPSQSILFNIDQKADIISKTEIDALLAVFMKVFDEMCGYYGKQGYIAQFERELDERGQYTAFKQAFAELSGRPWEQGREQALLEAQYIAGAYSQVSGTPPNSAAGILDKYRSDYRVSIEDFAKKVQAYIKRQEPGFRLIFFVDEVGQYIADNVKLMTNLQTVAESLATESRGQAWVVVTAQEDMNTVFGDAGKQQSDDFSKIQARFQTRMKLTSTDVEEVIRKRLLDKNTRGKQSLELIYDQQKNNFKTLFDFADGSQTYRNFTSRDHFIQTYPFVPYQFPLFQAAIQNLSQHNAFEGKHSSVGERSMLGVFQQVAIQIGDYKIGQLATFDLMFEGIRTVLKTQIQHAVQTAEQHLGDPFAVRVLKALFLVKYVREFKATARNMTVLMLDRFDADLPALRQKVEQALSLLELQTYIQRTGEEYEYLTDEEKDIEEEIKQTEVETSAVAEELGKLVFDYVIKDRKIRYDENGQDYSFSRKLDDRLLGREHDLTIHVVTPFHEKAGQDAVLRSQAMGRKELLVLLPADARLRLDLLLYKQTEKYLRQNMSTTKQETTRHILAEKQSQNILRYDTLRALVHELLNTATLVVDGRDLDIDSGDPKTRIVKGFHNLLVHSYTNLRMLRGINYTQQDVKQFLKPSTTLLGDAPATFSEAEQELLAFVRGRSRQGLRTTMQSLLKEFEYQTYGWYLAAIQCITAKLLARGKLEMQRDAHILEERELEQALLSTRGYANLVLTPQADFTPGQLRQLKTFYADFFDQPPAANEAKALGRETAAAFKTLREDLVLLERWSREYPFHAALGQPLQRLGNLVGKSYTFYLTDLHGQAEDLLDLKEALLDPLRRFMSGSQRSIYDAARDFLKEEKSNFAHLQGDTAARLRDLLEDPQIYAGRRMQTLKQLHDTLAAQTKERVAQEREATQQQLQTYRQGLESCPEFNTLNDAQQAQLRAPFDKLSREIQQQHLIAVLRDNLHQFYDDAYPQLLQQMTIWAMPKVTPPDTNAPTPPPPPPQYVTLSSLAPAFEKTWLADENDLNSYLVELKRALLKAINAGKRIQLP